MSLLDGGKPGSGAKPGGDEGMESYVPAAKPGAAKASGTAPAPSGGVFSGLRVSLMPSELEGKKQADPGKRLLALALVLVIETAVILGAYFFVNKTVASKSTNRDELVAKVEALGKSIAKEEASAKDVVAYQAQVAAAGEALDKHVSWTSFFAFIEKKTIPSVKYLNFSGDADSGTVTVDAVGLTYRDVAEQIVQFREEPNVIDVRTSSASARVSDTGEVTGVSFTLVLRLKPEVWKKVAGSTPASPTNAPAATPPSPNVVPVAGQGDNLVPEAAEPGGIVPDATGSGEDGAAPPSPTP